MPELAWSSSVWTSSQQTFIASRCDWRMLSFCAVPRERASVPQGQGRDYPDRGEPLHLTSLTSEKARKKSRLDSAICVSTSFLSPPFLSVVVFIPP